MNVSEQHRYAALILRVSLGTMYLAHSVLLKAMTFGLEGTAQFFMSIGYPGWLAYVVFTAEAVGGALLLLGYRTRLVALALIPVLFGATIVHWENGWVFNASNGGWEYPAFLIIASIVQALLGEGAFALGRSHLRQSSAASI